MKSIKNIWEWLKLAFLNAWFRVYDHPFFARFKKPVKLVIDYKESPDGPPCSKCGAGMVDNGGVDKCLNCNNIWMKEKVSS